MLNQDLGSVNGQLNGGEGRESNAPVIDFLLIVCNESFSSNPPRVALGRRDRGSNDKAQHERREKISERSLPVDQVVGCDMTNREPEAAAGCSRQGDSFSRLAKLRMARGWHWRAGTDAREKSLQEPTGVVLVA